MDILTSQKELFVELSISELKEDVVINNIRGSEAISELFEFHVNFSSANREIDAEKILGSNVTLHFKSEKHERFINGIITQFSQGRTSQKEDIYNTEYFFTMRPKLWLLSLDSNCQIFQKKSTMEIIKSVLKEYKIDVSESKCGNNNRTYCVQYNESSFNFISRLMEDEGIFYYFKHEKNKHTLIIRDGMDTNQKLKEKAGFIKSGQKICPLGKVFNTSKNTFMNVGGYSAADYNYENSNTKLFNKLETKWKGQTLFYEYPGGFSQVKEGEELSKLRVQEIECKHIMLQGDSTIPDFSPGTTFELTAHHAESFNDSYILCRVEHIFDRNEKNGFAYRNRFWALPKGTEFRPPRKTHKPKIYGNQTAVVVCPSKQEIYRDKYCCIKVHFHWDQKGKSKDTNDSSCWIRVAQLMAGSNWGAVYVPRVGQEVVVSFLEGDPDKPLVVGCVYNDQFKPPYSESQDKISTMKTVTFTDDKGFNEIRFNDEKEKEEIFIHAQKDMKTDIVNSRETKIEENNDKLDILKGSRSVKLHAKDNKKKADYSLELVKGNSSVLLKEGNSSYIIKKGNSTIQMDEGNSEIVLKKGNSSIKLKKGNQTIDINGDCTIKITGNLKIKASKNISIEAGKELSLKSGSSMKAQAKGSLTVKTNATAKFQSIGGFTCKSGATMTIKATGLMNIKSSAMMNIKSTGMLKVEGMALTNVTGAAVQINGKGVSSFRAPMLTIGGGMISFG
ncbi:MAG: translocation/assembly module TamB domain-containing protein [Alphaproteobacteria bacterium]|nr:translocation/assembly module TamB domain-containing protein [Alphaproteobacteria bacterium]